MGAFIPPSIAGTPGLPTILANGGWQILTERMSNMAFQNAYTLTQVRSGSTVCFTVRMRQVAMFAASHLVLVFSNCSSDTLPNGAPGIEAPGLNRIRIKAALQKNGPGGRTDESGARVPVTFNGGQLFGEVPPDGLLFSDPVGFDVAAGEEFFVRYAPYVAGPSYYVCASGGTMGGTAAGSLNLGEGLVAGDVVLSGNTGGTQNANTNMFNACLGFSATPQRSVALIGDSICAYSGDGGVFQQHGGYLVRVMRNQTVNVSTNASVTGTTPNFPYVKMARGSGFYSTFANRIYSYKELRLAELATTVICEYGTNDLAGGSRFAPVSLSSLQQSALTVASYFTARGKKFIACTLVPRTASTDGWATLGGQSFPTVTFSGNTVPYESARAGYNLWLRDTSSTGFVAQANAPGLVDVWVAAAGIEVNSAGAAISSTYSAPVFTGSITSLPALTGFTDSSQTAATGTTMASCSE